MTWLKLIMFAVISGLITGLIAMLVPEGNSFRQIAVTFEAWIVLAIVVVVNCDRPMEAACKTFVYFLISQPLVYRVQVPFHSMGFGLFKYYYPYWFYWTIATFPGAFIAWYIRKDDIPASIILSVALVMLVFIGCGYLRDLIRNPPKFLISTLFCFGSVPLLIFSILRRRNPRFIAAGIAVLTLLAGLIYYVFGGAGMNTCGVSFGLDREKYPVTSEWTVRLEDPASGNVSLYVGDDIVLSTITVTVKDVRTPSDVILTDPEGNEYCFPAAVEKNGNGETIVIYEEQTE